MEAKNGTKTKRSYNKTKSKSSKLANTKIWMGGKAGSRNNEVKMSLEALTGEMNRAASMINNGKKSGWTEQIDKNILPENILMAKYLPIPV